MFFYYFIIKIKQKELEQMMEYELKLQEIRRVNEEKMKKDQGKQEKRERELLKKRKEAEEQKRLAELEKKRKMEEELEAFKKKAQEMFEKVSEIRQLHFFFPCYRSNKN